MCLRTTSLILVAAILAVLPNYALAQLPGFQSPDIQTYVIRVGTSSPEDSRYFYNLGDTAGCNFAPTYNNTTANPVFIWSQVVIRNGYTDAVLHQTQGYVVTVQANSVNSAPDIDSTIVDSSLMSNGIRFELKWGTGNTVGQNQVGSTSVYMSVGL